jgi:hypothetical protein
MNITIIQVLAAAEWQYAAILSVVFYYELSSGSKLTEFHNGHNKSYRPGRCRRGAGNELRLKYYKNVNKEIHLKETLIFNP